MSWLWISPHLDDVALSCAGSILRARAEGHDVVVATVFSAGDGEYERRRREDEAALALLDARAVHLGLPDAPFRAGLRCTYQSLVLASSVDDALVAGVGTALARLAQDLDAERVFLPLGVGRHIDHRTVFETHAVLRGGSRVIAFYEERPYAFAPIFVDLRLTEIGAARPVDSAAARAALEAAFRDLPLLRAYVPEPEREPSLTAHVALAIAPAASARIALQAETAVFSAEDLTRASHAVARYQNQVADLFGTTDAAAIARAYAAVSSQATTGASFAERTYRYSSRFFQSAARPRH